MINFIASAHLLYIDPNCEKGKFGKYEDICKSSIICNSEDNEYFSQSTVRVGCQEQCEVHAMVVCSKVVSITCHFSSYAFYSIKMKYNNCSITNLQLCTH